MRMENALDFGYNLAIANGSIRPGRMRWYPPPPQLFSWAWFKQNFSDFRLEVGENLYRFETINFIRLFFQLLGVGLFTFMVSSFLIGKDDGGGIQGFAGKGSSNKGSRLLPP